MQKELWARTRVNIPRGRAKREKKARSTMPRMISGIIMGSMVRYSIILIRRPPAAFVLNLSAGLCMAIPTAPRVPSRAARKLEIRARTRLFLRAANMARSLNSSTYQPGLKPLHTALWRLSLKEYTITNAMGTYIKVKIKPI
jgi:hypothetical protein